MIMKHSKFIIKMIIKGKEPSLCLLKISLRHAYMFVRLLVVRLFVCPFVRLFLGLFLC